MHCFHCLAKAPQLLTSLAGMYLTTNSALLYNGLQQLGYSTSKPLQGAMTSDGSVPQLLTADSRPYCSEKAEVRRNSGTLRAQFFFPLEISFVVL
jgi:hypothetical protein